MICKYKKPNADYIIDLFGIREQIEILNSLFDGAMDEIKNDLKYIISLKKDIELKYHYSIGDKTRKYSEFKCKGIYLSTTENIVSDLVNIAKIEEFKFPLIFGCIKYYIKNPNNIRGYVP